MSLPMLAELPYRHDSGELFDAIADRPWAVFLDSGHPYGTQGRYDVLACDPVVTVTTRGAVTEVRSSAGAMLSPRDPFALLREQLGVPAPGVAGLPFCGGAIGYFAYDLARRLERLPTICEDAEQIPQMAVGLYDWAVVVDHGDRRCYLVSQNRDPGTASCWEALRRLFSSPVPARQRRPLRVVEPVRSNMTFGAYRDAFRRIEHYIREGDCYQVNLAQRFSATVDGDPWEAYRRLRRINSAPFGAFLNTPWAQVLSASPERFLQVRGATVTTKPIKGTRGRSADPLEDRALARELCASAKDHAENLMIVDLLRNDIGKCCVTGSVHVPKLFALESFATVHHLVSTVTGTLAPDVHALELLRACFPGGSITGAPKLRAMEIIEELEPHRRGVYCGAVGYVGFDGAMDTNIAIRTLVHSEGTARFWAGGGIVADSELEAEYQETFDKAAALLKLLDAGSLDRRSRVHVGG
ncbi:MAG: aminodeoxychorismate synthase component I [Gammaproteobacteria bacterium]|jgi:para-aminobenzoate synthetase component I